MSNIDIVSRTAVDNVENELHRFIQHDEYKGRGIAVFTSGGDSQGMNAAVRAVVRVGLYLGCKVWFIKEGYQGLVDGEENIVEASWSSVSSIIHKGGTIIGSARCMEFRERAGRLKAARNLVFREITNLVVIGGDGSLTGANTFKLEWQSLLDELLHDGEINEKQRKKNQELHIVGLVGSIDNDFCGTDMTIGTDTALHRIMEAVDTITATAHSHQRTFIMEVMGRHCGYLGVVIANCAEADFVFIPEDPPTEDWPDKLCKKLAEERKIGRRSNIIVVSEGAQDMNGNPITGDMIKNVVVEKLKQDTRVTVLGHVQRGGNPSAFDRVMGCRLGVEAVIALMESQPHSPSSVVTLLGNQLVHIPLMDCVAKTKAVTEAMNNKDWKTAVKLRGTNFERNLNTYKMMVSLKPPPRRYSVDGQTIENHTIAVMHIGVQACGMNAAVRSIVRSFITPGSTVYGIHDGVDGLVEGKFQVMEWEMVTGWTSEGGAMLGIKRTHPKKYMREIAARFKQYGIQGLIIVGGFDAYQSGLQFYDARKKYPELCIPLIVLPASTNNNVPGTNFTVGCDTALNEIMEICDRIRQATQGLKRHVFIIESMGGHCGYLATLGGIASGSDAAYIFEEDFTIQEIVRDAENMTAKMNSGIMRGILLKSDKASNNLNTEFVYRLFAEQGREDKFTVSMNVIGQIQQGGNPSPFDRNFAIKLGARSVKYLTDQLQKHVKDGKINVTSKESAIMVGLMKRHYVFTPLEDLKAETNFDHRIPRDQWWLGLRPLARILAKHISTYGDLERKSRRWMVHSQSHFTELEQLSFLDYEPSSRTTIT